MLRCKASSQKLKLIYDYVSGQSPSARNKSAAAVVSRYCCGASNACTKAYTTIGIAITI